MGWMAGVEAEPVDRVVAASQGSTTLPCQGVSPSPERCLGGSGVYKCGRTDWLQGFQLTVLKQLPTEGSWFQGNPYPNAQAFY